MNCNLPCPIKHANICTTKCSSEVEQIDKIMQVEELWEDSIDLYKAIKGESECA